jgi:hypothetical protein
MKLFQILEIIIFLSAFIKKNEIFDNRIDGRDDKYNIFD